MDYKPRWGRCADSAPFDLSTEHEDDYIPFLDDAVLPSYTTHRGQYQLPTLHRLALAIEKESEEDPSISEDIFDETVEGVRAVLEIADEDELDIHDESLLMRAWETRNEQFATFAVRQMSKMSPSLETFDWYFCDGSLSDYGSPQNTVVWSWDIQQEGERTLIRGDLKYTGCLKGDPPPLYPYIGQELQYALKHGYNQG